MPQNSHSVKLGCFNTIHENDIARRAIAEERAAEQQRQSRYASTFEKIRTHRARGMSDSSLRRIYGEDVIQMEEESRNASSGNTQRTLAVIEPAAPLSSVQARLPMRRTG